MAAPPPPATPRHFELEDLPQDFRNRIYEDVADSDTSAVIASSALKFLKGSHSAARRQTRTDFAVFSTNILFKSRKTRVNYLQILQQKLIKDVHIVRAFVIDLDFTNVLKYIKAVGGNQNFAFFDERTEGNRQLIIHHSSTSQLPANMDPPSLTLFGKKMKQLLKAGIQPRINHISDASISASPPVEAFLRANKHLEVENADTTLSQLGKIFYMYKYAAIMGATNTVRAGMSAPDPNARGMAFVRGRHPGQVATQRMRDLGMDDGSARLGWVNQDGEWFNDEDDEEA